MKSGSMKEEGAGDLDESAGLLNRKPISEL